MSDRIIEFRAVSRRFGNHYILRYLDFGVEPGHVYALLGRNGAGKTTAIRMLLGFLHPTSGSTHISGRDSRELTPADRDRIGYVSEDHHLDPWITVEGSIRFERDTRPSFDADYARKTTQRCGLRPSQRVFLLSRGQRAQLALVLAVASQPDVLVFDDPAMGLDVVMRRELLDVLIDLLSERGTTVLFSTHILADVPRIADRVGILHDGALIIDATIEDIGRRIERRTIASIDPPEVEGRLFARKLRGGYELTLLDADDATIRELERNGKLSEASVPTLEDLFLDLTTSERDELALSNSGGDS